MLSEGKFEQLNYKNPETNQMYYKKDYPPLFPLENIDPTLEIYFFIGNMDKIADIEDVQQ